MGRYTYYAYEYDGDGGEGFRRSEFFVGVDSYMYKREKIADFDTAEELAELAEISVEEAQEEIDEYEERLLLRED